MQTITIVPCPKCNMMCVAHPTATCEMVNPLTDEKTVYQVYTCPEHNGNYIISGYFVIDLDAIPE